MQLIYEGVDITHTVDITKCIHQDVSGGRCDCLEIEMENASAWYGWEPKQDDRIEAARDGYSTGRLYLNTITPANGKYRIFATSTPSAARHKAYAAYEQMRLDEIMASCAAECGMENALFGVDGSLSYSYMIRENESAPAFLNRILRREGAVLKTLNGRLTAISIEYAQDLDAEQTMRIKANQAQVRYIRRDNAKLSGIAIETPYAQSAAADAGAPYGQYETYTQYPATDNAQAGRWARGLLLSHNRELEEVTVASEFNPGLTAMARMNIESAADFSGQWLIDKAEHDLLNGKSSARLLRCIRTIR